MISNPMKYEVTVNTEIVQVITVYAHNEEEAQALAEEQSVFELFNDQNVCFRQVQESVVTKVEP